MSKVTAPGGTWASPITFESLVEGAIHPSDLRVHDGRIHWLETRPAEGGRVAIMREDGSGPAELISAPFNARTRVHEYGGAPYVVTDDGVFFSNFADQRLHVLKAGAAPEPLTPEGFRYADAAALPGSGLVAVREDHSDPADIRNTVVRLTGEAGDGGQVLFGSSDFVAYPRPSPDGRRLAFIAWDHPNMPWDTTSLYLADLTGEGLGAPWRIAGGREESVIDPQWSEDGTLYFISDRTGFWNLYRWSGEAGEPVLAKAAEFAGPLWVFGQSNYALLPGGLGQHRLGRG